MVNDFNQKTALRTRRMPFRPSPEGDAEHGANVLPVGTHLGEFEILDLIGEGGFGIVYLAYDHSLERQVALKEYMPSGLAKRTTKLAVTVRSQHNVETFTAGLKSFINEARMLAQFDSPSLVKVHRFWEGNGTAYMVMPFYEGITLKQALKQRRITPTESWIRILLADLFDAIEIIHNGQCLHRDIAPDNILLLKDGRPLLLDFGAARRVIGDLTQCLTAILKPGYAPIEQYADIAGLRQGPWTDIYALAAVVYYLIAGKAPPPAVARMVHDELVPAREVGKGRYSGGFLAALDKALSVKPEQRFRSIGELRHALDLMETAPRTLPQANAGWTTTVMRTDSDRTAPPSMEPDYLSDVKTRIAPPPPPPLPRSERHASKRMERPAPRPPAHGKREWIVLGVLLTAGLASGIYLGTNPSSWSGLPAQLAGRSASAPVMDSSGGSGTPDEELEERTVDAQRSLPPAQPPATMAREKQASPSSSSSPPVAAKVLPPTANALPSTPRGEDVPVQKTPREQTPPVAALAREEELWRLANSSDKAGAYEKYLREYPKGRYAPIARLRLESKQARETAPSADEELWTSATAINTIPAYEAYLRKFPKGRFTVPAKDRMAALREREREEEPASESPPAVPPVAAAKPQPALPAASTPTVAPPSASAAAASAPAASTSPAPSVAAPASPPASTSGLQATPPQTERKATESTDKLASIKPPEKAAAVPPARPQEGTSSSASEPAAPSGRKPLVLADQTMTGNFSVDPKTGVVSGTGKIVWTNGNQFEGTLVKGSKEGKGKFVWSNGQRYTGDWARDMPNGRGTIVFADGSRYEGDVKDGMPHGRGATRFKSGDVYDGTWVRGKSHGHGRYTWANGSYWEGEFRDDKRTDNGKMVFADNASGNTEKAAESGAAASETQSAERRTGARESMDN